MASKPMGKRESCVQIEKTTAAVLPHDEGWQGRSERGVIVTTEQEGPFDVGDGIHGFVCYWGKDHRCKHLGIHDFHYFYCAAQKHENADANGNYAYPWPGAGKRLRRCKPDDGCPFISREMK